jgi:F0F1-type ATP synthase membrane subunit c/vacuolar-type H+-ATPase subunit K
VALLLASVVPEIEDPLPDRIGLGFPLAAAGAGGVIASVIHSASSAARRDQAINKGILFGFGIGTASYFLALAVQVLSWV